MERDKEARPGHGHLGGGSEQNGNNLLKCHKDEGLGLGKVDSNDQF